MTPVRLITTLACLLLGSAMLLFAQLQEPAPPVNIIIDSDYASSADDVGDHAVLWALQARGEAKVIAIISNNAHDYAAPAMRAIANYYGHPEVPVGAHKGDTPTSEGSNFSPYAEQITNEFGTPGDTRFNYPDAVTVYRQALANAPDHSVYIVANGAFQPLRDLLQSLPDSISPLSGLELVALKVKRLVCSAGTFPSGSEHNFRIDAEAGSYVFANWPGEIVSVGFEVGNDVPTWPSSESDSTQDPIKRAYELFAAHFGRGDLSLSAWGQVPVLYAVRGGIGSTFFIGGLNGTTTVDPSNGDNSWSQTPNTGHSYLGKQISAFEMHQILNPLLQGSGNIPIVRSISSASLPAGSPAQTVTLTGSNFFSDSQASVNGDNRPTTFISRTQLNVEISADDLAQAGTLQLRVHNAAQGDWRSNITNLTVVATTPVLTGISPTSAVAGSGPITLTATGSAFADSSVIQVNGENRSTTFISATQLSTVLTAADLATGRQLSITVNNPTGGVSEALTLTVNNPVPALSSLAPSSVVAGSAGFSLTINGSNFVPDSVVQVDGVARQTTFVSATQLTTEISSADVAVARLLSITVSSPGPGGGTSAALTLAVNNPVPALTSMSPTSVLVGSAGFTLTLNGSNFVAASVVRVNGAARPTTFVSATRLTAAIPASDLAVATLLSISVASPGPGGGVSGTLTFAVNNPVPTISSISPNPVLALGSSFTLTVNGTGYNSSSVVRVNGTPRPTTLVSATQLQAQIPQSDIVSVGQRTITVFNPAPGGGTSNAATLTVIGLLGMSNSPETSERVLTLDGDVQAFLADVPEPTSPAVL